MRQAIIYIKAAVLTGSMSLIIWVMMLYAGTEALETFFIEISLFIFLYFGVLAVIEKSPTDGSPKGQKEK